MALIFDLDGTLLDTLASLANSFNRSLGTLGMPTHPVNDYRYFIGDGLRNCVIRCLGNDATEQNIERLTEIQQADYRQTWRDGAVPYPGIESVLDVLGQDNVPMAVLSNKPHQFVVQIMDYFFPNTRFHPVMGHRPGYAHKPDPTTALLIADELDIKPSQVAFVGDTRADIETAVNAGMHPVGVLWGFREFTELESAGATDIIGSPHELLSLDLPK